MSIIIFFMSKLKINNIYIYSLRSICLPIYLSFIVKHLCRSAKSIDSTNQKFVNNY